VVVVLASLGVDAPVRRALFTVAVMLAGATAGVGPAVAEWSALRALRQGVARCAGDAASLRAGAAGPSCGGVAQVDVDVEGLRLWHPWREGAGARVEADELSATVDHRGVHVDARGLRLGKAVSTAGLARTPRPDATKAPSSMRARPAGRSPLHTRGVPVHVRVHGPATWAQHGVTLTVDDPELHLDGHGGATAAFVPAVEGRGIRAVGVDRWTAHAVDGDPHTWQAAGPVALADGPTTLAMLVLSRDGVQARLHDAEGGTLVIAVPRSQAGAGPGALEIRAERFALAALGRLGQRTVERWGLQTERAHIDAVIELEGLESLEHLERLEDLGHLGRPGRPGRAAKRAAEREALAAQVERLVVEGLVVDHRKLARAPVQLDALELHGELSWQGDTAAATLWLAHRDARLMLSAQLRPEALDLRTELAPLPCQALLDAFPTAMTEMVSGTRLAGQLQGRAELHLDHLALAGIRAQGGESDQTPGTLVFAFPFLERCRVVADDPRLDLEALSGPYRHRFVDDHGRERQRVMARGAPGYVPLREVPRLAAAFVGLEDWRFREHDGFDREQIEGAFWHNLVQGRVSRGASTISQQAARNLWLGVDRSWGRKLQEALLTARLEASTDKARIMELYLNVIELGPGTHGVDEAARLYFGKPAAELSLLQAIHLAALAPAPRRLAARFIDGRVDASWLDMLRGHVRRMHRGGLIGDAQFYDALHDELELLDRR
jgi:Transglycosylase